MSFEPIGIATILIGFYCLLRGSNTTIIAAAIASIFGASAAMFIGAANIQPGHVILVFLALGVITRRHEARALVQGLHSSEPGFWLAGLVIYGLFSAYFLPRLLEGATQIVPLGSTAYGETRSAVPLTTVSSNLTQSVYMVGKLYLLYRHCCRRINLSWLQFSRRRLVGLLGAHCRVCVSRYRNL